MFLKRLYVTIVRFFVFCLTNNRQNNPSLTHVYFLKTKRFSYFIQYLIFHRNLIETYSQWPIINLTVNDSALFIFPLDNPFLPQTQHNDNYWCNCSLLWALPIVFSILNQLNILKWKGLLSITIIQHKRGRIDFPGNLNCQTFILLFKNYTQPSMPPTSPYWMENCIHFSLLSGWNSLIMMIGDVWWQAAGTVMVVLQLM